MYWSIVPIVAFEERSGTFIKFPKLDHLGPLHEHWCLRRNQRPFQPLPLRTRMPEQVPKNPAWPHLRKEEQGRLYNLYMRPWTLLERKDVEALFPGGQLDCSIQATDGASFLPHLGDGSRLNSGWFQHVPHIRDLSLFPLPRRRLVGKEKVRSNAAAWSSYIHGNVLSASQGQLIVSFMKEFGTGRSQTRDAEDGNAQQSTKFDAKVFSNKVGVDNVHDVLASMVKKVVQGASAGGLSLI